MRRLLVGVSLVVVCLLAAHAPPATAYWTAAGGPTNVEFVPIPLMPEHACADRIQGRVGASVPGAPGTAVIPPAPYGTRTLQLFVSRETFTGATVVAGGLELSDINEVIPPFRTITTSALTALSPLETFDSGGPWTVYAAAAYDLVLPPGALQPGEFWALKLTGQTSFASGRAGLCDPGGTPQVVPTSGLSTPRGLAIDAAGNLFVADTLNDRVVRIAASGGAQTTVGFTGLDNPYGVAVDTGGNVFVADTGNDRVVKLPVGGGAQQVLPFSGVTNPYSVAVDSTGTVYTTDTGGNRIVKLSGGIGATTTVPITGLATPGGLAVNASDDLFVADTGNNRILRMENGTSVPSGLTVRDLALPFALAADFDGNVFVADYLNDRAVQVAFTERLGSLWSANQVDLAFTGLDGPLGVAIGRDGWAYVADSGNDRIVKLPTRPGLIRAITSPATPGIVSVDGVERDQWGLTWPAFPSGSRQICFGAVPGYITPVCQTSPLAKGSTLPVSGTYTPKGYLRVLTSPAVPSNIVVGGVPRNAWGLWAEVVPGTYNVCFTEIDGWAPPPCRSVTVASGATATTTGTFTADATATGPTVPFGYLRVVTNPAVGALISVDGNWRDNWGLTWLPQLPGPHEVCFGNVSGRLTPPCQTVNVTDDATTTVTASYLSKGYLRVATDPPVAASIFVDGQTTNAWGMWAERTPGTVTVCFGHLPGWSRPPCQAGVSVSAGVTTLVTGTYSPMAS